MRAHHQIEDEDDDSLSDEALGLCCQPVEVGLASERAPQPEGWRSRKDDYDLPVHTNLPKTVE